MLSFSVWILGVALLGEEQPQGAEGGLLNSGANHLCNSRIELRQAGACSESMNAGDHVTQTRTAPRRNQKFNIPSPSAAFLLSVILRQDIFFPD